MNDESMNGRETVEGDDLVIVYDGKAVLHATSHALNITPDKRERATKDNFEVVLGRKRWSVTADALVAIKDAADTNTTDTNDLIAKIMSDNPQVTIIVQSKKVGSKFVKYTGIGTLVSLSITAGTGADATYSTSIEGCGLTVVPAAAQQSAKP